MQKLNKKYKKIIKAYNKKLKRLQKQTEGLSEGGLFNILPYFVITLKRLRDFYILTEPLEIEGKDNYKIALLCTAIEAYTNYKNCINNYYSFSNNMVKRIVPGSAEEVAKHFNAERHQHWQTFWESVTTYLEGWEELDNATI